MASERQAGFEQLGAGPGLPQCVSSMPMTLCGDTLSAQPGRTVGTVGRHVTWGHGTPRTEAPLKAKQPVEGGAGRGHARQREKVAMMGAVWCTHGEWSR